MGNGKMARNSHDTGLAHVETSRPIFYIFHFLKHMQLLHGNYFSFLQLAFDSFVIVAGSIARIYRMNFFGFSGSLKTKTLKADKWRQNAVKHYSFNG